MKQTKPIIIVATIQPPDGKGKRKLTVAAAPDGQLPARTFVGAYPDLHAFIDQAWLAALTERPATVEKATAKPAGKKQTKKTGPIGPEAEAEEAAKSSAAEADEANVEAEYNSAAAQPNTEASPAPVAAAADEAQPALPEIEGDN